MGKKPRLAIFAVFLGLLGYLVFTEWDRPRQRKQHPEFTKAKIINESGTFMNGHSVDITFKMTVGGKEITRLKKIRLKEGKVFNYFPGLVGKTVDAVYEIGNWENCDILLCRNDYQEYGLTLSPDVARQIQELAFLCEDVE